MSRAYADEQIDVAVGDTATLDRNLLAPVGLARSGSAVIENSTVAGSDVLYRFGENPPTVSPVAGHLLAPGAKVTVTGYDNLVALQVLGAGSEDASLFVTYYT